MTAMQAARAARLMRARFGEARPHPEAGSHIRAGFPSPADDYIDKHLDLYDYLVYNRNATFFAHVEGDSMRDAGIEEGDLIVIDKSLPPKEGDIVVCRLDGEFTVKRLRRQGQRPRLEAANDRYPAIEVSPEQDFQVWGVVLATVKKFR